MKPAAVFALALGMMAQPAFASAGFMARVLAVHNAERAELDVPALVWNEGLAADALAWARHLAALGTLQHSTNDARPDEGENLWMGTAGAFGPEDMVRSWAGEKRYFRKGVFPYVSATGHWQDWRDVGHYTQMVWRNTSQIGCGLATGRGYDVLVCRYSPPGNMVGESPF